MLRVLPGVIFGDIVYRSKRRNDCVFVIKLAVIVYTEMQCVQDQPDPMRYGGVSVRVWDAGFRNVAKKRQSDVALNTKTVSEKSTVYTGQTN